MLSRYFPSFPWRLFSDLRICVLLRIFSSSSQTGYGLHDFPYCSPELRFYVSNADSPLSSWTEYKPLFPPLLHASSIWASLFFCFSTGSQKSFFAWFRIIFRNSSSAADLLCSVLVRSLYGFFQHPGCRVSCQSLFWLQSQDLIKKVRALFRLFIEKERLLKNDISQRCNQGFGMMCFYGP